MFTVTTAIKINTSTGKIFYLKAIAQRGIRIF